MDSKALLQKVGLKNTKQRQIILEVLAQNNRPLTAEEIFQQVQKSLSVNPSTIYRTLFQLKEKGLLQKLLQEDGVGSYQLKENNHQHKLVCTGCSQTVLIDECPVALLSQQLEKMTGYLITGHQLIFTGLCPKCAAQKVVKKE